MGSIKVRLRDHQGAMDADQARFQAWVLHRRAGKSYYATLKLFEAAVTDDRPDARYYYIGPSFKQAKAISFDYLREFSRFIPGHKTNIQELSVTYPHGPRIALLGVENADALRGRYADGVVMDEAQLMAQSVWAYVVRPLLADRRGWGWLSGTPAGWRNLLGWARERVLDGSWGGGLFRWNETNALDPAELEEMRAEMSEEAWQQEMECSFEAALQGAYYSRQMHAAEVEGRICDLPVDPALPVFAAVDLGWRDATAVWYFQAKAGRIHVVDYDEFHRTTMPEIVAHWRRKPFPVAEVLLPHDAAHKEQGTGLSRLEVVRNLGVRALITRNLPRAEGIEAVRLTLPLCLFDRARCERGLQALKAYRQDWDDVKGIGSLQPIHDDSSHGADAFRYLCVGRDLVGELKWGGDDRRLKAKLKRRAI